MKRPSLSIGIEEEYQTIDPETRDLRSHIQMEILPKAKLKIAEQVKPEMHQAVVEVGSKVCRDIKEAREDMRNLRREMISLAAENGLLLGAASTHPFARTLNTWFPLTSADGSVTTMPFGTFSMMFP